MRTLHEELCKFMVISRTVLFGTGKFLKKPCRENQTTHFIVHFFPEICAVYEIMWKVRDAVLQFYCEELSLRTPQCYVLVHCLSCFCLR